MACEKSHHDLLDLTLCAFTIYIVAREGVSAEEAKSKVKMALFLQLTQDEPPELVEELKLLVKVMEETGGGKYDRNVIRH